MDLTNEMHVTKPFGPTIGEIQVVPQFVKDLNDYTEKIIKDEEKSKIIGEMQSGDYDNLVEVFDKYFGDHVELLGR